MNFRRSRRLNVGKTSAIRERAFRELQISIVIDCMDVFQLPEERMCSHMLSWVVLDVDVTCVCNMGVYF